MHVHPDGEGLTGRGGSRYALVFTVVMRPALMIFGFIASIAIMYPFGYLINETFASVFQMSVDGSSTEMGLLTSLAGAFIYVGVMMTIVNKVFSLIHILPDQIIRWVGGSQDYFGKGMEQEATAGAKGGMSQMISTGQQAYSQSRIAGAQGGAHGGGSGPYSGKVWESTVAKVRNEKGHDGWGENRIMEQAQQEYQHTPQFQDYQKHERESEVNKSAKSLMGTGMGEKEAYATAISAWNQQSGGKNDIDPKVDFGGMHNPNQGAVDNNTSARE